MRKIKGNSKQYVSELINELNAALLAATIPLDEENIKRLLESGEYPEYVLREAASLGFRYDPSRKSFRGKWVNNA